jgi:DNA-binding MarR family transcriptional regulator
MKLEKEIQQSKFQNEFQKLYLNIIYTASWLNLKNTQRLKPYGISPQQYNILRILRGQHPNSATVTLLTERMLDKNSNASRLV